MKIARTNSTNLPATHLDRARRGVTLVLTTFCILLFLTFAACWLNVAHIQLTRTQLKIATDSAARSGGEALSRLQSRTSARDAAKSAASLNLVAGQPLALADADIVFGNSTPNRDGTWSFQPNASPINSLQVHGQRTKNSASGAIPLLLGRFLGVDRFETTTTSSVVQLDRDICLVLDRSGSMDTRDAGNGQTRWEALRQAVTEFRRGVDSTQQSELVGLASYSTTAGLDVSLTGDYSQLDRAIGAMAPDGWTNISGGIDNGIRVLTDNSKTRPFAYKTMVVLTDGIWNRGRQPVLSAQDAARANITIHTVTFSPEANQADMKAVAEATGGRHFHAPNGSELQKIFREIALTLPIMFTN
jgi:Ca-activated chloride channel family protein